MRDLDYLTIRLLGLLIIVIASLAWQPWLVLSEEVGGNKTEIEVLDKQIEEKRAKIRQLEQSIADYKQKIQQKRLEAMSLSNQMAILDNRIAQVELDIEITEEKLETLTLEIESLQLSIAEKELTISQQKTMISELLRTLHQKDNRSYLEILAAYNSFSDFYNQIHYLQTVETDLARNAKALRLAKEELQAKKQQTEERKLAYIELKEQLVDRQQDQEEQIFVKQQLLAQTQSSELTFKTLLSSLRQQYQQIENEITSIEQEVRKRLEKEKKIDEAPLQEGEFTWPTQSRYITALFHDPEYPYRHIFEHSGIDIRASHGTPIKAAATGYVARAKRCSEASCYSYVMIVHRGGLATVYGHLSNVAVTEDQFVTQGDIIGYSGGTPGTVGAGPFVTGAHLHFEIRKNGIPVDPLGYLEV